MVYFLFLYFLNYKKMRANDILLQLLGIYGQACNNYYRPIYMKRITARACVNISGPAVIFFV